MLNRIADRKIQCLKPLVKALSYEVDWIRSRNRPECITPSVNDYTLASTAPKALKVLGCSLSRYLMHLPFILNDLGLDINNGYLVSYKAQKAVSHLAMLRLTERLLKFYERG